MSNSPSLGMIFDIATEKLYFIYFFLIFHFSLCESDWFCVILSSYVFVINSNLSVIIYIYKKNVSFMEAIMTQAYYLRALIIFDNYFYPSTSIS